MSLPRYVASSYSAAVIILGAAGACAQDYPSKPIRIVTSEPGGGVDLVARLIAPGISVPLGQPVVIENRGGGGSISAETVARATPDGYSVLVAANSFWIGPLLQNTSYDPVRDFSPITMLTRSPNVLVVYPSVAANSVKELSALAKARPGTLNYASGANGASTHLAAELFKTMAGINIVRINYKGTAGAFKDLISGEVQLMFPTAGSATPHIKLGRLRALAVTSAQPSPLAPGLPTMAAAGLPGYESTSNHGAFAPAGTSKQVIKKLNEEIVRVINKADVKEKFFNAGIETVGSAAEELAAKITSDTIRLGKLIKDAGIRTN